MRYSPYVCHCQNHPYYCFRYYSSVNNCPGNSGLVKFKQPRTNWIMLWKDNHGWKKIMMTSGYRLRTSVCRQMFCALNTNCTQEVLQIMHMANRRSLHPYNQFCHFYWWCQSLGITIIPKFAPKKDSCTHTHVNLTWIFKRWMSQQY